MPKGRKPSHSKRAQKSSRKNRDNKRKKRDSSRRSFGHRPSGEPTRNVKRKASVQKNPRGFAFLVFDDSELEDLFVPARDARHLFHGDRLELSIDPSGEVEQIRVLSHQFREVVGQISFSGTPAQPLKSGSAWISFQTKKTAQEIFVPKLPLNKKILEGDWVRAELQFDQSFRKPPSAKIVSIYGEELPATADIDIVSGEFNLTEKHPDAVVEEAKKLLFAIPKGRKDFRKIPFITIDGKDARDFDDAVYVEKSKSGYTLWVAIADASHYVKIGSKIDKEALARATSVYFPEKAFHMVPPQLSENLCSLRPNEDRLAICCRINFDESGTPSHTYLSEAVINSKRRATYEEIQKEYESSKKEDWEYSPHFSLYKILRKKRMKRGALDLDMPEAVVELNDDCTPKSITPAKRLGSHQLIEEFMIAANEAVTNWMLKRKKQFLYRAHEDPEELALKEFMNVALELGLSLRGLNQTNVHQALEKIKSHRAAPFLTYALLRSLKQAVYTADYQGHFGLASTGYTHFTSPIRRYPDLIVHRLLKAAINDSRPPHDKGALASLAEHCNYQERKADDASRMAIRLKQIRLMQTYLGDEFEGYVSGMTKTGFFIQLNDPFAEGFVPIESLPGGAYRYNEDKKIIYEKKKKLTFRPGDIVKIRVERASLVSRKVEFSVI